MRTSRKTVDDLLAEARAKLERVPADRANEELSDGAIVMDTRTYEQRRDGGLIPGAHVIPLNSLEWRVDPASPWRIPPVVDHDVRIIVVCQEGFSSSLAAARLQSLGLHRATDLIDGFEAWRAAGLSVEPFHEEEPADGGTDVGGDG